MTVCQYVIQTIFLDWFPVLDRERNLPPHWVAAACAIMTCRTKDMGGHYIKCLKGHLEAFTFNSCKHRSCPICCLLPNFRFLAQKTARLLRCRYYHVVFTIPHELNDLFRVNYAPMAHALFLAARDTINTFFNDPKHLGAQPGMMSSLHTWGRNLAWHPHLHMLLTAGGWTPEGWVPLPKENWFLRYSSVRKVFRRILLDYIKAGLLDGSIQPRSNRTLRQELNTLARLRQKEWHIKVIGPYSYAKGVMQYLARYVRGGPVADSQIESYDGTTVVFLYKDHHKGMSRLRLPAAQFVERILMHVPPKRLRTFRVYGIFHNHLTDKLNQCRAQLQQKPVEPVPFTTGLEFLAIHGHEKSTLCSKCGSPLRIAQRFAPGIEPPCPAVNDRAA